MVQSTLVCTESEDGEKSCVNESDVKRVVNSDKVQRKGILQNYNETEREAMKDVAEDMGYSEEAIDSAIRETRA